MFLACPLKRRRATRRRRRADGPLRDVRAMRMLAYDTVQRVRIAPSLSVSISRRHDRGLDPAPLLRLIDLKSETFRLGAVAKIVIFKSRDKIFVNVK
jgi:hypothetical protein